MTEHSSVYNSCSLELFTCQTFGRVFSKLYAFKNVVPGIMFASPEIEDIFVPHSLVSGVCYIAVG